MLTMTEQATTIDGRCPKASKEGNRGCAFWQTGIAEFDKCEACKTVVDPPGLPAAKGAALGNRLIRVFPLA
jgi:hypothetical protein